MRSSAFVTMAIGSPVQGSLRTLRNIEEAVSTPSTVLEGEISTPTPIPKVNNIPFFTKWVINSVIIVSGRSRFEKRVQCII